MKIEQFINSEHEDFYKRHKAITDRGTEYAALVYTLGINADCRRHFSDLYDMKESTILPEGLHKAWQTAGSRSITRLAFNLFTDDTPGEEDAAEKYAPRAIFEKLDDKSKHGAILSITYFL